MNQPLTNSQSLSTRIEGKLQTEMIGDMELSMSVGGLSFDNMLQVMEFAKMMSISGVAVPKHLRESPGACLAVTMQAFEWGFSPFAVANKSYSVNDRMAYESQLIQAVILKRAPIKGRFVPQYTGEGVERQCLITVETLDGQKLDYQSPKIRDIKVKNSPLWQGDPDQQLYYFSARAICRRHFPDVILGVYSREELEVSEPIRDVTAAAPSGLAARLATSKPEGGFDADSLASTLAETTAATTADQPEANEVAADPVITRDAASAAASGGDRIPPDGLSDAQSAQWLAAYDSAAATRE